MKNLLKTKKEKDIEEKKQRKFVVGNDVEPEVIGKSITLKQENYDELERIRIKNGCDNFDETVMGILDLLKETKETEEPNIILLRDIVDDLFVSINKLKNQLEKSSQE